MSADGDCSCPDGEPNARGNCYRCGRRYVDRSWRLSAESLHDFYLEATAGRHDITGHELTEFVAQALVRALGLGKAAYGLHDFLKRPLAGEPEAEQLDSGNYGGFQALKDRRLAEAGLMDPVKAEESLMRLRSLTADTVRLHADWRAFWAWHDED